MLFLIEMTYIYTSNETVMLNYHKNNVSMEKKKIRKGSKIRLIFLLNIFGFGVKTDIA